jgi:hypothetical protein
MAKMTMAPWTASGMKRKKIGCPDGMGCSDRRGRSWMGGFGKDTVEDLGLSLMAITSIFSVHASISPSYATFSSFFSKTPEEQAIARETLYLSLGASTLSALGIYFVFKKWIPAVAAEIAGIGLFALGMYAVHKTPPATSTMDVLRQQQLQNQAATQAAPAATPATTQAI